MKSLSPYTLFEISKYFSGVPSVLSVYLLGSANRGELREDSDIDLALLPMIDTKISSIDLYHLTGELGYQFGYEFDFGIIGSDNLVYSKEAIFTGNPFFALHQFEIVVEQSYFDPIL